MDNFRNINYRHERLLKLLPGALTVLPGLLTLQNIPKLDSIKSQVSEFLFDNLDAAYPNENFQRDQGLEPFHEYLRDLVNRTPNGLVLFQKETQKSYAKLHNVLATALGDLLAWDRIAKIHVPVNIRVSFSGLDNELQLSSRPLASQKEHIDVWAGEPINSFLLFLPVFGDVEASGVEYYNCDLSEVPLGELSDFADYKAVRLPGDVQKMEMDTLHIADCLVFHRTIKKKSGFRVSIDFRGVYEEFLSGELGEIQKSVVRQQMYKDTEIWRSIGKQRWLETEYSFSNIEERLNNPNVNASYSVYPHNFRIV